MTEALAWFRRTHEFEALGLAGGLWRLRHFPRAGGLEDQDARLMDALDHIRLVKNALLRAGEDTRTNAAAELRTFHEKHRRPTVH